MVSSTADGSQAASGSTAATDWRLRHPVMIVAFLVLLSEVFAFEFTVVQPGLPDIAAAFGTSRASLVMSTPFLVSAVVVPLLAKWGDIHGKKHALLLGSAVFALGTVVCALTTSYVLFLVGRGLEAFGLIGTVVSYGLVRDLLPPRWVPIGIGGMGTGLGMSAVAGPLIGGTLLDTFGFRSNFWFLLGYVVVLGLCVVVFVPGTPVRLNHRLDLLGGALLGIGIAALIFASTFTDWWLPAVVVGVVFLAAFVLRERSTSQPLMPMRLLMRPALAMTLLCAATIGFVVGSQSVIMPQMLRTPPVPGVDEQGLGLSGLGYALNFALTMGVCAAGCGFLAGFVSRRFGPRLALLISAGGWTIGCGLIAAGFATGQWQVVGIALVMGVGQGFYYAATANLVIEAVPATTQGVSASMKYMIEQSIASIAGAAMGTVVASDVVTTLPKSGTVVHGMGGFHHAFLILTVVGAIGFVVALLMRHGRSPASGGVAPDAAEG